MALRKLKPTTPATRYYSISSFEEITKTTPE
ncbi:MAG: 50S ribosomal protein L2, partial [Ignavibacteria bacterium]